MREFLGKYAWLAVIIYILVWNVSQSLADRDDTNRIQNQLNRKAEELYQRDQEQRRLN